MTAVADRQPINSPTNPATGTPNYSTSNDNALPQSSSASAATGSKVKRPYRGACLQWVPTDSHQLATSEKAILEGLQYHQQQIAGLNTISSVPVTLRSDLSEETVQGKSNQTKPALIMLHGFAGGSGHWRQNWEALSAAADVFAVDLPGFARSSRFAPESHRVKSGNVDETIAFYEEKLNAWLLSVQPSLEGRHVTVLGHSCGGYLVAQLLARHLQSTNESEPAHTTVQPQLPKIHHMILADPWGVPAALPEDLDDSHLSWKIRFGIKLFYAGAPLAILRAAGPWGPNLLPKMRPDFAERWAPLNPLVFYDYTYHCNAQTPATGEFAFRSLAHGRGFAKRPLIESIPQQFQTIMQQRASNTAHAAAAADVLPHVTMLYGAVTWMDRGAGHNMATALDELYAKYGRRNAVHYDVVANAGHQLNTDNAEMFNDLVVKAIRRAATELKQLKQKIGSILGPM